MSKATGSGFRSTGRRLLAAVLAVCAAIAFGPAHGGLAPLEPTAWLEAAFDLFAPHAPEPSFPDLSDGRSAVDGRWRGALQTFERDDREQPPAAGGVVIVGSSSVSAWNGLEAQLPHRHIVRRGLGGAHLSDCIRFLDRLVLPYRPRLVVLYAGDNDLAEGDTAESVFANYVELVRQVQVALPATRVAFVSIKPSPSRAALLPEVRRANALVAAYSDRHAGLDYIDVFGPMLDAEGRPRPELFRPDGLHLNVQGYAIWRDLLERHLDEVTIDYKKPGGSTTIAPVRRTANRHEAVNGGSLQ